MIPCFFSSEISLEAERILTQHGDAFSLLGSGEGAEFLYYTHDISRNLMFLTESAWSICRVQAEKWLQKSLQPILTDAPCNDVLIPDDSSLDPNRLQNLVVEIWDNDGERVKLEVWRRLVLLHEEPIGVVGMARRKVDPPLEIDMDLATAARRIATLTQRERDVIELVIQGELNKSIARKLEIAIRTVEARRSKAMSKLNVNRVADLVRLWLATEQRKA
jgi:DNA-binding CsgD family transcriptional regulator